MKPVVPRESEQVTALRQSLGQRLAALRHERGLSQHDLAKTTYYHRSSITKIEAGQQPAPRAFWENADQVLGAGGALVDGFDELAAVKSASQRGRWNGQTDSPVRLLAAPEARPSDDLSEVAEARLARGDLDGMGAEPELIGYCEALTDSYRQLDYRLGSRMVLAGAVDHLDRMMSLGDRVPSHLYRRFVLALADIAQLCAWLAIDGRDYATARRHGALALACADEGGDARLRAYVMGVMSTIHLHCANGEQALRLLNAAQDVAQGRTHVHPAVRSWLWEATGEAHAMVGNASAGAAALHRSETLFDLVEPADVPSWLGFYNAGCHSVRLRGRGLVRLGEMRAAIVALEEARRLLPSHFVREHSGTLIDLAAVHVALTEPEHAVELADEAFRLALSTGSERNQSRVRALLPALAPFRALPAVRELTDRLR